MLILPFVSLGIGFILGWKIHSKKFINVTDKIISVALILLMTTIGINIGINSELMMSLGAIGINCAVISLLGIIFSVICVFLLEKTFLPLEKLQKQLALEKLALNQEKTIKETKQEKVSLLIFIMPVGILSGIIIGFYLMPESGKEILDKGLKCFLILLYIGVGISISENKGVFTYLKTLGAKVLLLPLAIIVGSLLGGIVAGIVLDEPQKITLLSSAGMSYYSITGAYMTGAYGIEVGTYGFVVNVMREFFTIIAMPILVRISKGSPIAGGAAGNMDTMLMPITKFVGPELGLVTLITGTILTFFVPFLLPFLNQIIG